MTQERKGKKVIPLTGKSLTPEYILNDLQGELDKIETIIAVVYYKNGSGVLYRSPCSMEDSAMASLIIQKDVFENIK